MRHIIVAVFCGLISFSSYANDEVKSEEGFKIWLEQVKAEARDIGISTEIIDEALSHIKYDEKVVQLDRHQPEFTTTFTQYISKRVSETRINNGRKKVKLNKDILENVSEKIGVQERFISAIWGMETNYGSYMGRHNVIQSLATLAYDGRRGEYFRRELFKALEILDEGHISADKMEGSWAGAMGQGQFMPSSFYHYAYDLNQDGKKDIWNNTGDALASIAHYLKKHDWNEDENWGREVKLPADVDGLWKQVKQTEKVKRCRRALKDHSQFLPLDTWRKLGVKTKWGSELPQVKDKSFKASLVMPEGKEGPAYLTYGNFRAILSYNCSNYYALGVALLSDHLR